MLATSTNLSDGLDLINLTTTFTSDNGSGPLATTPYVDPYPDSDTIVDVWYWLVGIFGSLIGCIGIVCNMLSLGVLCRREMRSTGTMYLIALAVYDLIFLLSSTMFVSMEYFHYGLTGKSDYYFKLVVPSMPFSDTFMDTTVTASAYTTILLSVDRAIGVSQPLKWPQKCTRTKVKVALALALTWAILLNIPLMLQYRWVDAPANSTGTIRTVESDYSKTFFHEEIYLNIINPIFDSCLPLVIIIIANFFIAKALHLRHKTSGSIRSAGQTGSKTGKDASRVTTQVIFISLMTALTRALRVAMFVSMEYHDTVYVNFCPLYCGVIAAMAHFSNICNATINFFCFCYFGPKYRTCFLKMYGCGKLLKKSKNNMDLGTNSQSRRISRSSLHGSTSTTTLTSVSSRTETGDRRVSVFTAGVD